MERFIEWCKEELKRAQQQVEAIEAGRLHTGSRTDYGPMLDTTADSLAHAKRVVTEMSDIIARQAAKQGKL